MNNITTGSRLSRAIIKSVTGRYAVYGVQLISLMIMARLFTPEVFGLFSIIQVFAVFFALFSEMGLGPAIINEKEMSYKKRNGIFTVTWLVGISIGFFFWLSAPIIVWFYNNEIYNLLVIPISISVIFNTAAIVPMAALQKDKSFLSIARCDIFSELASLATALLLIESLSPILVLACKPLAVSIVKFILLWLASERTNMGRAWFGRELKQIKPLLKFANYQFGFNFVNYFSRNLDNILVGKYFGTVSLGIYDKAYQLMRYPLMLLTFAMAPAIQPVLTEIRHDKYEFERLHNKLIKLLSLLGFLVGITVYIFSPYIVKILLGAQWNAVTHLLEILSITIPIQIVLSSSGGFFQAAGRADLLFKCGVFSSIINITAIIVGIFMGGLDNLCWAILCAFSINFIQCYYVMGKKMLPNGCWGICKQLYITIIGTVAFAAWVLVS